MNSIKNQSTLAEQLDMLKLKNMASISPNYPLAKFAKSQNVKDSTALFGTGQQSPYNESATDGKKSDDAGASSHRMIMADETAEDSLFS